MTGMLSNDSNCGGNENRNGIFIFNKHAEGFTIYNDGKPGTAFWMAIGM